MTMKPIIQIALAVLSGVLVAFSFPTMIAGVAFPALGWLGWVALVPLFFVIRSVGPRRAFLLAFLWGLVCFSVSLFWLYGAIHHFGHLSPGISVAVLVLLIVIQAAIMALAPLLARLIQLRWRGEFIVWIAVSWTALELMRNLGPANGFPWGNIAMSQWRFLPAIQIADLVGIYGVTFLVVWMNAFIADIIARLSGERVTFLPAKIVVTILLIGSTLIYGIVCLHTVPKIVDAAPTIQIGMIQANIPQDEKWAQDRAVANLDAHRMMAHKLERTPIDLIIWPESAIPWTISERELQVDAKVIGLFDEHFGPAPYTLLGGIIERADGNFHNSALLYDAQGMRMGLYHKAHLVPFGEYVPYKKLLFFASKLTEPIGNFLPGQSFDPIIAGAAKLGILICYEDVFPEIAAEQTRRGANLLVNLTNDAWYGHSSAPFQHLAISAFRAVESRRSLVRATNTGVSAVITPTGAMVVESGIFEPSVIVAAVPLMEGLSVYAQTGDWFAIACAAYVALGLIVVLWRRFKYSPPL